jgi:hypothetical protein
MKRCPGRDPKRLWLVLRRRMRPGSFRLLHVAGGDVFGDANGGDDCYVEISDWSPAVQVFVGRNGSGKTRAALAIFRQLRGRIKTHYLAADRLSAFSTVGHYGGNLLGPSGEFQGIALMPDARQAATRLSEEYGLPAEALLFVHDNPHARMRVAAAVEEAAGRAVDLTYRGAMIDPVVSLGPLSYPLLRSEGHGLRELVVLLAAIYRPDWKVLIVDEPELNLHPSLTRLWMNLLRDECEASGRKAIVITHEPLLVDPQAADELRGLWLFRPLRRPVTVFGAMQSPQVPKVDEDLRANPRLVPDLVFSPYPVLVEGDRDLAAFQSAAHRLGSHFSVAQTDFIQCGGTGGVARWLEIARDLDLDVLAVADLDALFSPGFARTADKIDRIRDAYMDQCEADSTREVIRPLHEAIQGKVQPDAAARREWLISVLASDGTSEEKLRKRALRLLAIWRDAGIWLHPQGDLERALGMDDKADTRVYARAAENETEFDAVVRWALYRFDGRIGVQAMLESEVERIAQEIQRSLRLHPELNHIRPVGPTAEADSQIVTVQPLEAGRHRITVKEPFDLCGWTLEFDRTTSPAAMQLRHAAEKE